MIVQLAPPFALVGIGNKEKGFKDQNGSGLFGIKEDRDVAG